MSEVRFQKLHRPDREAGPHEQREYRLRIKAALESMGVGYGEEFAIVRADSIDEQGTLEDLDTTLGPFSRESETSRNAALDNYPRSGSQRWRILQLLERRPDGRTRDEISSDLQIPDSSADARVGELRDHGFIEETERTRKTRHGSEATILVLTDKGGREIRTHGDNSRAVA